MMIVVLHEVSGAQPYSRQFIDSKVTTIRQAFRFFVYLWSLHTCHARTLT